MSIEKLDDSIEMVAFEISSRMFDLTVDAYLKDDGTSVLAYWEDTCTVDEEGEAVFQPHVMVNGLTGRNHIRRIMEWTTDDKDLIKEVGEQYEEKMARMWEDTIEYYEELDDLGRAIHQLSVDPEAGYLHQAEKQVRESGEPVVYAADVIATSRALAITALTEWVNAVEEAEDKAKVL